MGYHKNQLIANQVELGDRVPAPRPAASHVSWNHPVFSRRINRHWEREHNRYHRGRMIATGSWALAVGLLAGFAVGVFA